MRRTALSVLCALVLAGCGGAGGSAGGDPAGAGAEIAPADAVAFVAIDTDRSSEQWKSADALLKKFQFRDELIASANRALSEDVDFEHELLPVLGDELDLVVVDTPDGPQVAGLAQPTDEQRFNAALAKGSEPTLHKKVGDWTVFADEQAALDAVTGQGDNLADADTFADAMDELPGDANAKAYVAGAKLESVLRERGATTAQTQTDRLRWLSLALSSHEDGVKLDGAAKSTQDTGLENFEPTLLGHVPAGSLLVVSFKGADATFRQLRDTPDAQQTLAQLQQALGVSFEELTKLVSGEGVFFVQKSAPFPEATLILKEDDPRAAVATLNRLARRAAMVFGGQLTKSGSLKKLSLGSVAIYFGVDGDNVVVSDSRAAFGREVSSSIDDDPVYAKAKDAARVPDESAGLLYLNVKDSVPLLEGFAQASGETLPPELMQNLAPLQSLIGYATADGDTTNFSVLLQVR
jgi:hypothetical protein